MAPWRRIADRPVWRQWCQCYLLSYLGADLVLDEEHGPQLLELNARPGLSVQIANGTGLLPRLQAIEQLQSVHSSPAERVDFAMANFAACPAQTNTSGSDYPCQQQKSSPLS
ncbi:Alpha-L-glutamate ligase family protein [Halorhodospira halochloris]|uniref:Alpha-L-glutamate ligase family protein n=1 Tax=Halorhodospira halochloris TaxID=1052 RepID=A0A110B4K2_HALHR|nr:Alpha-L-glutamate ligase family protein [Halorhodospira halochloris]